MDTRSKILSPEQAIGIAHDLHRRGIPYSVIRGHFDVLQPSMLEPLGSLQAPVFAVVLDPPAPLLAQAVRAELAAGLRMIDYVIPWSGDADQLVASLAPDACAGEEAAHAKSTERLIEHVRERHGREFERRRKD